MTDNEIINIERRVFETTEGKWFAKDDSIIVILPEISLEPIVIANIPANTISYENNINFIINARSDVVNLLNEVKRLRALLEINNVDYVI
jgi:hypothetical protein